MFWAVWAAAPCSHAPGRSFWVVATMLVADMPGQSTEMPTLVSASSLRSATAIPRVANFEEM